MNKVGDFKHDLNGSEYCQFHYLIIGVINAPDPQKTGNFLPSGRNVSFLDIPHSSIFLFIKIL
jgi:hypothetical protein